MVNRFTRDNTHGHNKSHETRPYTQPESMNWRVIVDWYFPVGHCYEGLRTDVIDMLDKAEAKEIAACYRGLKNCTDVVVEMRSEKYLDGYV